MGVRPEHKRALEANEDARVETLRGTQGFFEQNRQCTQSFQNLPHFSRGRCVEYVEGVFKITSSDCGASIDD